MKWLWLAVLLSTGLAWGDPESQSPNRPVPLESRIGLDQRVGDPIPLQLSFRDETGASVTLGSYFGKRPVILAPVYYECPSLCGMVMGGIFRGLSDLKLEPGVEFAVVFVSINPKEEPELAARKKANFLKNYMHSSSEKGIHFLVGEEKNIKALTSAIGFKYEYDAKTKQYAHPGVAVIATPEGKISRYHFGVDFPTRDLRLSLVNASGNKIGSVIDQFLLFCYHYDPTVGKYGLAILNGLRVLSTITFLGLGYAVFRFLRRERLA